jgi:hypothetical protein
MGSTALCEFGRNGLLAQEATDGFGIIAAIALHNFGLFQRPSPLARNGRYGAKQRQQLRHIVGIGARQDRGERDTFLVDDEVMLAAELTPIDGTGSRFFPANMARTEELSTMARARSSWPRSRNSASNTSWIRCHTPACCHWTKRRQQAVPEPQPISCGNKFHAIPERNTNTIPVKMARSSVGLRPAYRRLRSARFGNNGSIRDHSSLSISSFDIALHPEETELKVNTAHQKLTALFIPSF